MRFLLALAFCSILITGLAWQNPASETWKEKIQPSLLEKAASEDLLDFVVVMKEQASLMEEAREIRGKEAKASFVLDRLKALAEQTQSELRALLSTKDVEYSSLYIVNAIHAKGDLALIKEIAAFENVAKVLDNPAGRVEKLLPADPPATRDPQTLEWGVERINADDVWALGYKGEGVVIGGEDTGYKWDHPALISKYRGWDGAIVDHNYSWHDAIHELSPLHNYPDTLPSNNDCGLDISTPCDDQGHGTWTMGIMVGDDGDDEVGVAPESKWIGCRNMEGGWGTPFTYLECFEFFLAPTDLNNENPDPAKAPHVINNSWGCPEIEGCNADNRGLLELGVNNLKASGVFVVVSAGNDGGQGCSSIFNPASIYENSFSVGATSINDTIGGYSSRGPVAIDSSGRLKPNVVAPGTNIRSTSRSDGYTSGTGTSGAGPFVAGTVALMISANPALAGEVDQLEDILEQTAVPKTSDQDCGSISSMEVPNNVYGYGRIDALAAVERALTITSVQDNWSRQLQVYPNPVSNLLTLELPESTEPVYLFLYDATGRMLNQWQWQGGNRTETIDMSRQSPGIYFYQLQSGSQQASGKLIRQ